MPDFDFNTSDYKPDEFEVVEAGEYDACIVASEKRPNSKNNGHYLRLTFQIINGKYQNRTLFENLNLWNQSQQATEIARKSLSAIVAATGAANPSSSEMLHDKAMKIKVAVEKRSDNGEMKNVIKGYKPLSKSAPVSRPATAESTVGKPW